MVCRVAVTALLIFAAVSSFGQMQKGKTYHECLLLHLPNIADLIPTTGDDTPDP